MFKPFFSDAVPYYALIMIIFGAIYPFINRTWNKDIVNIVLSLFKISGAAVTVMLVFQFGPGWLLDPNIGPYLFEKLVIPVGVLVPIGAVFLALLVGYGLLEFFWSSASICYASNLEGTRQICS